MRYNWGIYFNVFCVFLDSTLTMKLMGLEAIGDQFIVNLYTLSIQNIMYASIKKIICFPFLFKRSTLYSNPWSYYFQTYLMENKIFGKEYIGMVKRLNPAKSTNVLAYFIFVRKVFNSFICIWNIEITLHIFLKLNLLHNDIFSVWRNLTEHYHGPLIILTGLRVSCSVNTKAFA